MRLSHLLHIDGTASVRVNGGEHLLDARLLLVVQYPRLCATTSVVVVSDLEPLLATRAGHKCSCAARTFELVICAMSFRSSHSAAQPLSARGVCSSGQGMMRTCLLFRFLIDKQVSAVLRVLPRPARRGRHAALGFGSSGTGSAVRHVLHRLYEINNVPWQHRPLSFVDVASSSAQTKHKGESKSGTKPIRGTWHR